MKIYIAISGHILLQPKILTEKWGGGKIYLLIFNLIFFKKFINLHFLKNIINKIKLLKEKKFFTLKACSSVDRASDSDSESQGFDSLHAYGLIFKN
jgi:hypothetical protein